MYHGASQPQTVRSRISRRVRAFICDSDILIYDNITEVNDKYLKQYPFMLCSSPSKNLKSIDQSRCFVSVSKFEISNGKI